ncbi:MAG TPA: glutathione S-transferase family protein [Candidatus Polarisedimenticolaceae bacterium]|nr:glutathione S-transferase family protein [Candidatus Polarisedimenticolaceae bacterium]
MKLIQIPFSHNCIKVRVALAYKNLPCELEDIPPRDRSRPLSASRQGLVPVLVDGDRAIADSTAILLYLEERHPDPPLLPKDPQARARCLVLEDWADRAFMESSRRIAYGTIFQQPGRLASMFFPGERGLKARIKERAAKKVVRKRFRISDARHVKDLADARRAAALAVELLGGRPWLFDQGPTVADIALATMSSPLHVSRELRDDPAVRALLAWGVKLLPPEVAALYTRA